MGAVNIGVLGAAGRMGQALIAEVNTTNNCSLLSANKGDNIDHLFSNANIVIDFTAPVALENHLDNAIKTNTALVIGTTGLDEKHHEAIKNAAKHIPIIYASNMSVGVATLVGAVKTAAKTLGADFSIEIIDKHHVHKKDAPSGTALSFEGAVHEGAGKNKQVKHTCIREGEVAGEHTVVFKNDNEEVAFSHKAKTRDIFAKGAVIAALWLHKKPAGLYSINDVLGI